MLKPGWLQRQFEQVEEEVNNWPSWMRREAGFEEQTMTKPKEKSLGQIAYRAYYRGAPSLPWEALEVKIRTKYERAANAVAREAKKVLEAGNGK